MHRLEQRFPDKRAFITGAASGLGLAIAERLAARGWRLLLADINEAALQALAPKLQAAGAQAHTLVINVADAQALVAAAAKAEQLWGGIDLVFNNAGIASGGLMEEITQAEWERVIDIDLWSVIYGCRAFIPLLKRQRAGHIINTASSAGTLAMAEMANYNVAKAGVVALSETLSIELCRFNIGVTVVCPTVFKTGLAESMLTGNATVESLRRQIERTKVGSDQIADHLFKRLIKGKLYVMTQPDARWGWRLKRFFPELYGHIFRFLYRNRKWIYAE